MTSPSTCGRSPSTATPASREPPTRCTSTGPTGPGIVAAMTNVVARHGGNIVDLGTRLGQGIYVLIAEFLLPVRAWPSTPSRRTSPRWRRRSASTSTCPSWRTTCCDRADGSGRMAHAGPPARPCPRGGSRPGPGARYARARRSTPPPPTSSSWPRTSLPRKRSRRGASGWRPSRSASPAGCSASTSPATPRPGPATGCFVLCNAEVVEASRRERGREGCMSVPDFTGDVARARRLTVRGQLPVTGEWVTRRDRRLRGGRRPARGGPHPGPAVPRPGGRSARHPPAPHRTSEPRRPAPPHTVGSVPVAQPAEAGDLKSLQCEFESRRGHEVTALRPADPREQQVASPRTPASPQDDAARRRPRWRPVRRRTSRVVSERRRATSGAARPVVTGEPRPPDGPDVIVAREAGPGQSPAYARSRSRSPSRTDGHSASMTE